MIVEPDYDLDLSYLDQRDDDDSWLFPDRQSEYDRAQNEGGWGIVGQFRCPRCGQWESADSVWGFIGDDWRGSGYDTDVWELTMDEYDKARDDARHGVDA